MAAEGGEKEATAAAAAKAPAEALEAAKGGEKAEAAAQPAKSSEKVADSCIIDDAPVVWAGRGPPALEKTEPPADDATYGLAVDVAGAYDASREIIRQLHGTLADLKGIQAESSGDLAEAGAFTKSAHQLQLQLLALRRMHRAMAKASEVGKAGETVARRIADAEFAFLETKKYESACCRAAASYCRCLPTPELSKVRPHLGGADSVEAEQAEEEKEAAGPGGTTATSLTSHLHTEHEERTRLLGEYDGLERERLGSLEAFGETQRFGGDLIAKLLNAEAALEPVCDLLELRPRKQDAPPENSAVAQLPTPLRLIHNKFDVLAAFGSIAGITVEVEGVEDADGAAAPPAKRPRTDGGKFVRVIVDKVVTLRFASAEIAGSEGTDAAAGIVGVAATGGPDGILDDLWPLDDGMSGPLAAAGAKVAGRAYGWAQVLGGLRGQTSVLLGGAPGFGGPLADGSAVVASDVVRRLRSRLAAGKS